MKVKSRKQNIDLFKIAIEMRNNIRTEIHNKVRNIASCDKNDDSAKSQVHKVEQCVCAECSR